MFATLEATEIIDVGTLTRRRDAPPPSEPRGFAEPAAVTRVKQRAVIAMSGPSRRVSPTAVTSHLTALSLWAPHFVGFVLLCAAWCVLGRPELLAIVPVKLAGWVP